MRKRVEVLGLLILLGCATEPAPDAPAAAPELPFEGAERMPSTTPVKIVELVVHGDRLYLEALGHLVKSDPKDNPAWQEENRQAQLLFRRARDEGYLPAQDLYPSRDPMPEPLLSRVREATMHEYLCRKRSVSSRP